MPIPVKSGPSEPLVAPESGDGATLIHLPLPDIGLGSIYNSVTHPDVTYIPQGFMGFRYWMVCTPYPDLPRELPNVFCSNDGVNWVIPPGGSNPVALRAEAITALGAGAWIADGDMIFKDNQLILFYCRFNGALDWQWIRRTSKDGAIWSDAEVALSGTTPTSHSPAFVVDSDGITAFYVKGLSGGTPTIHYRTSTNNGASGSWSAEQNCTFPKADDDRPDFWHMDVIKVGNTYHALVLGKNTGESYLWYYTSTDRINWTLECHEPAIPYSGLPLLDGLQTYRSTFVGKEGGLFDIWVSGQPRGATDDSATRFPTMDVTANTGTDFFTTTDGLAHFSDNGDEVVFSGTTPPGNITFGTTYFMRDRTNTTFKVAATKGGAAIDLVTTNGVAVRASRNPWRLYLLRNTPLPVQPTVVCARTPFTNVRTGGGIIIPPASTIFCTARVWPDVNGLIANRFFVEIATELRYILFHIGAQSGNIEVGIARAHGADHTTAYPLKTSGVIACPATGAAKVDIGRFILPPGDYWLYCWADNGVFSTYVNFGDAAMVANSKMAGFASGLVAAGGRALPKAGTTLSTNGNRSLSGFSVHGDF